MRVHGTAAGKEWAFRVVGAPEFGFAEDLEKIGCCGNCQRKNAVTMQRNAPGAAISSLLRRTDIQEGASGSLFRQAYGVLLIRTLISAGANRR